MIAIDTNLLVHAHRRDAALHTEAVRCVVNLAEGDTPWAVCFHSFVEFYGVVSNPRVWARASTPAQAKEQIEAWLESPGLRVLTDSKGGLVDLLELATRAKVTGAMVHEARIASCCLSNGVGELWTVDRDFSRFGELRVRNPLVG